jgi:hypothetical protein
MHRSYDVVFGILDRLRPRRLIDAASELDLPVRRPEQADEDAVAPKVARCHHG